MNMWLAWPFPFLLPHQPCPLEAEASRHLQQEIWVLDSNQEMMAHPVVRIWASECLLHSLTSITFLEGKREGGRGGGEEKKRRHRTSWSGPLIIQKHSRSKGTRKRHRIEYSGPFFLGGCWVKEFHIQDSAE